MMALILVEKDGKNRVAKEVTTDQRTAIMAKLRIWDIDASGAITAGPFGPTNPDPVPVPAAGITNNGYTATDTVAREMATAALSASGGVRRRASASPNVYGNAGIIDALLGDRDLWHLWCFGDSRTNGTITSRFAIAAAAASVPLGGVELISNPNNVPGFSGGVMSSSGGDAILTSPIIGAVPDVLTKYESQTAVGSTSANNTTASRLSYANYGAFTLADFAARLTARDVHARVLMRMAPDAWSSALCSPAAGSPTMPNLYLQVRQNGSTGPNDPGYFRSHSLSPYRTDLGYITESVLIPAGHNWATYNSPDIGVVAQQGITIGQVGKKVAFSTPWLELPSGVLMHEVGCVPGRSIRAMVNDEIMPSRTFDAASSVGGNHALFLACGSNNPENHSAAQFKSRLHAVAKKFRAQFHVAPVICTTNYAAEADGSTEPYYVQALRDFASEDANCVVIDTYAALPKHAQALALGYYAGGDGVHYIAAGQVAYATAFWALAKAA